MIARDAVPIGHDPPRKRIDFNPGPHVDHAPTASGSPFLEAMGAAVIREALRLEHDRIWQLVVEASGGSA